MIDWNTDGREHTQAMWLYIVSVSCSNKYQTRSNHQSKTKSNTRAGAKARVRAKGRARKLLEMFKKENYLKSVCTTDNISVKYLPIWDNFMWNYTPTRDYESCLNIHWNLYLWFNCWCFDVCLDITNRCFEFKTGAHNWACTKYQQKYDTMDQ